MLLNSFSLNGQTKGFYLQTQKLEDFVVQNKQYDRKVLLDSLHLNGRTFTDSRHI